MSPPLLAFFLAAFSIGTSELVIAGLLPTLAQDLDVTVPAAGLLISVYAVGVAVGGPVLAIATGRMPRRRLLLILMMVFVAAQFVCALAPGYWTLMLGRMIAAPSHGLFFGVALVLATGIVAENRRAFAISLVSGGVTIANLIGAPMGTAVGYAFGWRWVFLGCGLLVAVATVVVALVVPADRPGGKGAAPRTRLSDDIRPLRRPGVFLSFLMIIVSVTGYLVVFSYLSATLIEVTEVPVSIVPLVLVIAGVGGAIGTFTGGRLGDWQPMLTIVGAFALSAAGYVLMSVTARDAVLFSIATFALAVVAWTVVAPVQARIIQWSSDAPNLVSTLISTAFNIGIALGAWIGGVVLTQGWTYQQLPLLSAGLALTALVVAVVTWAVERRWPMVLPAPAATGS
jgi:MFS transporter, DHA1 family, inner membrane transport protein